MLAILDDLNFTNFLLLCGLVVVVVAKVSDLRGWTRSTALVRQENTDLRERNATLQATVERLDQADREKGERIAALQALVEELQERDQKAVLETMQELEAGLLQRHSETLEVLKEIAAK
jgi:cell division septum initiation protein DivIVA